MPFQRNGSGKRKPLDRFFDGIGGPAVGSGNRDDRNTEFLLQLFRVRRDALLPGNIIHGKHNQHREAGVEQLGGQEQVPVGVGGIHNVDDEVGRFCIAVKTVIINTVRLGCSISAGTDLILVLRAGTFNPFRPEEGPAGNALIYLFGIEAVRTWEVDNPVGFATDDGGPCFSLDRDAGIVGDLLPEPCKCVKQGGFAGIGIASQRNRQDFFVRRFLQIIGLNALCPGGKGFHRYLL